MTHNEDEDHPRPCSIPRELLISNGYPSPFTPLDSLKECVARGALTLDNAVRVLNTPDALALPEVLTLLVDQLDSFKTVLEESISFHLDLASEDAEKFSDGRPVRTTIPLGKSGHWHQPWSADPTSPRDQPRVVGDYRFPDGTRWRIAVLRAGVVDAMEVE